jgi:hypothetical protein
MKIICNTNNFQKREDLIIGSDISFKDKLNIMNINESINFDNEFIDEKGYSYLKTQNKTEK